MNRWYERRKEAGLCTRCGAPSRPGRILCGDCAAKQNTYWNYGGACNGRCDSCAYPDCISPGSRGAMYRERRRAAGLCILCGTSAPMPGRCYCAGCARKQADRVRERTLMRIEAGLCTRCGRNAPERGRKTCRECLAKDRARRARTKGARA